jgi:hypothetical protein
MVRWGYRGDRIFFLDGETRAEMLAEATVVETKGDSVRLFMANASGSGDMDRVLRDVVDRLRKTQGSRRITQDFPPGTTGDITEGDDPE